jgi:hypothetical protein
MELQGEMVRNSRLVHGPVPEMTVQNLAGASSRQVIHMVEFALHASLQDKMLHDLNGVDTRVLLWPRLSTRTKHTYSLLVVMIVV